MKVRITVLIRHLASMTAEGVGPSVAERKERSQQKNGILAYVGNEKEERGGIFTSLVQAVVKRRVTSSVVRRWSFAKRPTTNR